MQGELPNRMSTDRGSPYFDDRYKHVDVWLDGVQRRSDVHEYCISEGWILVRKRSAQGKHIVENGQFVVTKLSGTVEARWKPAKAAPVRDEAQDAAALSAAEAKRARKAEKLARTLAGK